MSQRGDEILELAANGYSDKEIADQLMISVRTVEGHWKRLRDRTGQPNRAGVLGALYQQRLDNLRSDYESQLATLQNSLVERDSKEEELNNRFAAFEDQVRERSRILHEELNALHTQVSQLKSAGSENHLAQVILKSNVLAYRIRFSAPHECLYMSASVRQYGFRPDDFTERGTPVSLLIHPEDAPQVLSSALLQFNDGADMVDRRYRIMSKRGEIRWVYDRAVVERDSNGNPESISAFAFDITHLGADIRRAATPYPTEV
ncbi:MAG: PAS domain-containing protein [Armatimonadetes bacterium]|nr:PAS domain-containing protein [Armatimonadota bacterium]